MRICKPVQPQLKCHVSGTLRKLHRLDIVGNRNTALQSAQKRESTDKQNIYVEPTKAWTVKSHDPIPSVHPVNQLSILDKQKNYTNQYA